MAVIGNVNTNEGTYQRMYKKGQIPTNIVILDFQENNYNLQNQWIKKLIDIFPKEWVLFENGQYLPLKEIKKQKERSRRGKILNNLLEYIKEEKVNPSPSRFYPEKINRISCNGGFAEIDLLKKTVTKIYNKK